MSNPKKPFIDDVTIVSANFLNSIFGGNDAYSNVTPQPPELGGHIHDTPPGTTGSEWGHAPKIDLTNHVAGRLTLPQPELKSIKFSATQASPLTSSLYWTVPIPSDAYVAAPQPMFLNIYWSANGSVSPGNVAFRVDWEYIQIGQNVIPPSILLRGASSWPANVSAANNPLFSTMRFSVSAAASVLYVNDSLSGSNLIQLSLPSSAALNQYLLLGLEITTAPTVILTTPMQQVNIFAIELLYYSQTMGLNNSNPTLVQNNPGLADF